MQVPLEVSFRDVEKTPEIEELIDRKVAKLEKIHKNIISCRIAVDQPQRHQRQGNPYEVRLIINVPPGHEIVVKNGNTETEMHEPLEVVLRNAFDTAYHQLNELIRKQRRDVKKHPDQETMGFVDKIFPEQDYGFIKTIDGLDVYFHRNSVLHGDFDRLSVGTGVRYVEEEGEKGLQASTVEIVDKPGVRTSEAG